MRNLLLLALASTAAGCVADVDTITTPEDGDIPPVFSEAALTNTEHTAFNYFVNKGLTDIQAAGVVGNLVQESSVSPTAVEYGGGPGRGIAQWSVGGRWDHSAGDNMTAFAAKTGASRWALQPQLDFIWFELTTFSGYGLANLRAATTLSAAVYAFQAKYEICGACDATKRNQYAQQVYSAYHGTASGSGGSGSGSGSGSGATSTETCYSSTLAKDMPENACVQSKFDDAWYQCDGGEWVDRWSDPTACNGVHPL